MTSISSTKNVIYGLSCTCHPEKGVRYVGLTTMTVEKRVWKHKSEARLGKGLPIYNWLRKHGEENLCWEILQSCDALELNANEILWIAKLREQGNKLMNVTAGGDGLSGLSADGRLRMSVAMSGRVFTEEHRANMSIASKRSHASGRTCTFTGQFENNSMAKLTEAEVLRIIASPGSESLEQLADKFDISVRNIRNIFSANSWKHLDRSNMVARFPRIRVSKYSEQSLREVRILWRFGMMQKDIAIVTGVNVASVSAICSGRMGKSSISLPIAA